MAKTRQVYESAFRSQGLRYISGAPLFILVEIGERAGAVRQALVEQRKIYVRNGDEWDLPGYLRVSYGLPEENEAFLSALEELV